MAICSYTTLTNTHSPTLTTVFHWLRSNHHVQPKAYLSDCDRAITKAIDDAYRNCINPPKHYWCAVHVIKAARRRAAEYVSANKSYPHHKLTHTL